MPVCSLGGANTLLLQNRSPSDCSRVHAVDSIAIAIQAFKVCLRTGQLCDSETSAGAAHLALLSPLFQFHNMLYCESRHVTGSCSSLR